MRQETAVLFTKYPKSKNTCKSYTFQYNLPSILIGRFFVKRVAGVLTIINIRSSMGRVFFLWN